MKKSWLIVFFSCIQIAVFAQFYTNPEVKDGIYYTMEALRNNTPIPFDSVETSLDQNAPDFYEKLLLQDEIIVRDSSGTTPLIAYEIFAVGIEGVPFIHAYYDYYRCITFGKLCYFATVNPLSGREIVPTSTVSIGTWGVGIGIGTPTQDIANQQFIFDLDNGLSSVLTRTSIIDFIASDDELLAEYKSLKRKQQRDQLYLFIRRFNENHPLWD
tara:strand:+ start:239 stop:880 length:642 start_codon:yes stop_codon:yes gene_type:complete